MNKIKKALGSLFLLVGCCHMISGQTVDETNGLSFPIDKDTILYFQVVPSNSSGNDQIDALFALSEGPVRAYSDCSTILRFNNTQPSPYLDVYDGGYTRTNNVAINFNETYHCWFVLNFEAQKYDTYVLTDVMETPVLVHEGAAFRKTNVTSLTLWSSLHFAGSSANPLLVKNIGFVESLGDYATDWLLLGTTYGTLNEVEKSITKIPPTTTIESFYEGLGFAGSATVEITDASEVAVDLTSQALLSSSMKLKIIGIENSEYTLEVRSLSTENEVLTAFNSNINTNSALLSGLYKDLTVAQFKTGLVVSPYASYEVINGTSESEETDNNLTITNAQKVIVTAENGDTKTYSISVGSSEMPATVIANDTNTFYQIAFEKITLEGAIQWHIKSTENPLPGSILNITSEDVWIYFDHIRPQRFFDNYLDHIRVNGELPEVDVNVRLVQYGNGSVLIGHSNDYIPLTAYADTNLGGSAKEFKIYTYYRANVLGEFADNIESFVLKKGFMATFADGIDGTGNSQVFIANDEDIVINEMPSGLVNNVSFVRVLPWRWTTKKSFSDGSYEKNVILNSSWRYNWDNTASSTLDIEYVPMRHNPNWPAYSNIINKENVTHALHFNEPDNSVDDGYSTVEGAIAQWPNMLASGLRVGTPAPTDGGVGWLYDFIDACAANNYRVDFVAIHFYRGGQSTQQFYDFIKSIHDRTGLPIWITEWNNGANWTCCAPTYESQAETIDAWVDMLEAAPFVERYALYGRVEETRQLFYNSSTDLTPAGEIYRDKISSLAYQSDIAPLNNPYPANEAIEIEPKTIVSWTPDPSTSAQKLYFGESFPPTFKTTLSGQTDQFDLGELDYNKTYYWRVDQYKNDSYEDGADWEFTTITFIKPYAPSPANEAEGIIKEPQLSWSSDSVKQETHWLYFGESLETLEFKALLPDTITQFTPGKLKSGSTYYWRIDEHLQLKGGANFNIEGDLWSFSVNSITGLNDGLPELKVWPVPVTKTLHIEGLKENTSVSVYNILGSRILTEHSNGTLELGHLPSGVYLLCIDGYNSIKIIK